MEDLKTQALRLLKDLGADNVKEPIKYFEVLTYSINDNKFLLDFCPFHSEPFKENDETFQALVYNIRTTSELSRWYSETIKLTNKKDFNTEFNDILEKYNICLN